MLTTTYLLENVERLLIKSANLVLVICLQNTFLKRKVES